MYLPISLASAAAAAFINLWLSFRIGKVRSTTKISVGDGGNEDLVRRMRAQANFIENTPIVLVLIAVIELSRPANHWLAGIAAAYVVARVAHAIGMDGGPFRLGRMVGTLVTMVTLLGLGIWAATIAIGS
jgi:uncharacterized membrane protein YecN with MAPEG domain